MLGEAIKLCECGCGEAAPLATYSKPALGYVKGQPVRFVSGHNNRGRLVSDETRKKLAAAPHERGADSPNWRGGTHLQRGRRKVWVGRDHAMADSGGYVFEYRLALAEALGRMLTRDEHVHHVDLDETNNAVSNLVALSNSEHRRVHWLIKRGSSPLDALWQIVEIA